MDHRNPHKRKRNQRDVTLKDIAEAVGKSVAAVSRALNDYKDISEETRAHIKKVAEEMGYTPNLMAQRLQKQAVETLGFIIPALSPRKSDPYYSELLAGIAGEAAEHGFDLLVSTHPPDPEEELAIYRRLAGSRRVDGIIIARPREEDERIQLLTEKRFPFIVIGDTDLPGNFLVVTDDVVEGARIVVKHLIEQKHHQIALINTPSHITFSANFADGFRQAMAEADLPIQEDFIQESDFSQKAGYQAGQFLLSKPEIPTAIVVADDVVALGVMAAAQDQGFQVGYDLAVTGYGDILLTEHSQPPLTTLNRLTYQLGQQACRLLIAQLQEKNQESDIIMKPSLVIRQSSDLALWL